jgi:acetyl-CoA carboxylase biotin carboxyl carrier protein
LARGPQNEPKSRPVIDAAAIRELAKLLDETGLTEIEVEQGDQRIRVRRQFGGRNAQPAAPVPPGAVTLATAVALAASDDPAKHPGVLTSPMVGVAYFGPEPGARPFVEVGSQVVPGQTLLIVEAMKTMNQIPAPRAGTVTRILIEDGQPVEYGEPLMIIE